jgi:hypothetical protein
MPVVINEMEVEPQAAPPESRQHEEPAQAAGSASPEMLKAVKRMLHTKQQRDHRLEAY